MHSIGRRFGLRNIVFASCASLLLPLLAPVLGVEALNVGDAYVHTRGALAKKNFGKHALLRVDSKTDSFLQFSLATLPPDVQATEIRKATLRLFVSSAKGTGDFEIWSQGDGVTTFNEMAIDNESAPAGTTLLQSFQLDAFDKRTFIAIDVTDFVKSLLTSGKSIAGFRIQQVDGDNAKLAFDSKENKATGHEPELDIQLSSGGTGPKGDKGDPGIQGLIGPQGLQGLTGAIGPIGPIGPQGLLGPEGPIGPQGIQGLIGPQGLTGPQGLQGLVGPEGPIGPQGIQGLIGPQGLQGIPGLKGDKGDQGEPGVAGPAGVGGLVTSSTSALVNNLFSALGLTGLLDTDPVVFACNPSQVTVATGDKIFVTSSSMLGSTSLVDSKIVVYIGYRIAGTSVAPTPVGNVGLEGFGSLTTGRRCYSANAILTNLPPGNYEVGLVARTADASWTNNSGSNTSALIFR